MIGFENKKILSWNIRGAMNENNKHVLKELIRSKRPDFVIILETRCQYARVSRYWESLDFCPAFISEATGFSGGIWVLKSSTVSLSLRLVELLLKYGNTTCLGCVVQYTLPQSLLRGRFSGSTLLGFANPFLCLG